MTARASAFAHIKINYIYILYFYDCYSLIFYCNIVLINTSQLDQRNFSPSLRMMSHSLLQKPFVVAIPKSFIIMVDMEVGQTNCQGETNFFLICELMLQVEAWIH
jgi:hypothetical protein